MTKGIIVEKQIQIDSVEYKFRGLYITCDRSTGEHIATVTFEMFADGKYVDSQTITYSGEDFNIFARDFNTWSYLYQQLNEKLELKANIDIEQLESTFNNQLSENQITS